jgi:Region found in RelA / SpoT proteins
MRWVEPEYTKKRVQRAGESLISGNCSEHLEALNSLSNWRAAHSYPMHAILIFLRRKSFEVDSSAVVVQRLKRTPSILSKLARFQSMKLHRMQDISGCRSVLKTVEQAEKLAKLLENSNTTHKLHKVDNYIDVPKESGYRGIHLVYKYNGTKEQYQDYFVEIQLRSKIQHAWATTVEIVDTFTSQALKASQGSQDWLDFFLYASSAFAKIESRPVGSHAQDLDIVDKLTKLERKLNAINQLQAFAVSSEYLNEKSNRKSDYFLLELHESAQRIGVTQYPGEQLSKATIDYLELEKKAKDDITYNVVLVSATSVQGLKAAYPNYFADSRQFIKYLKQSLNTKFSSH